MTANPANSKLLTREELLIEFPMFNIRQNVLEDLSCIYSECSSPGWDGRGAHAIMFRVIQSVDAFIGFLPKWVPDPELTPEADGEISVDWNVALEEGVRTFSISIAAIGGMNYAGVMADGSTVNGYLTPSPETMLEIESLLKKFFST